MRKTLVFDKIKIEQDQLHLTRVKFYEKIQKHFGGITVVSFFTSFVYPVMLEDGDAEMLEAVLQKSDLKKGLILFISCPGGDGLAAERIINLCRTYSGNGKFYTIVPAKAKSAATMICLGSNKIIMGKTSELGAVDPQLIFEENGKRVSYSVYRLLENYNELFKGAVKTKGNIEPFLQQLSTYDPRDIAENRAALETSSDIAIKALKSGMLSNLSIAKIKKNLSLFLVPKTVKTHGRPIYAKEAQNCGLYIEIINHSDTIWEDIYELYSRLDNYVSRNMVAKCVESLDYHYVATWRN